MESPFYPTRLIRFRLFKSPALSPSSSGQSSLSRCRFLRPRQIIVTGLFFAPVRVAHFFAAGGIFVGLARGCLFLRRDLQTRQVMDWRMPSEPLAVSQNRGRGFSLSRRVRPAGVNPICRSDVYCVIVTIEWYVLLEPLVAHRHSAAGGFSLVLLVRAGVKFASSYWRFTRHHLQSGLRTRVRSRRPPGRATEPRPGVFCWLSCCGRGCQSKLVLAVRVAMPRIFPMAGILFPR